VRGREERKRGRKRGKRLIKCKKLEGRKEKKEEKGE